MSRKNPAPATVSLHSIPAPSKVRSSAASSGSDSEGSDADDPEIAIDIHTEASKRSLAEAKERLKEKSQSKSNSNSRPGTKRSHSSDESSDSDDDENFIEIPFELTDLGESDYHLIKTLLKDYLDDLDFPIGELADIISSQFSIGAAIKAEGTEEPLGFLTALNTQFYSKKFPVMKNLRDHWMKKCRDPAVSQKFSNDFSSPSTGLMISHRVINVPQTIVPHLHDALIKDIEWARENRVEMKLDEKMLNFDRFILVARCFQPEFAAKLAPQTGTAGPKKAKRNPNNKQNNSQSNVADLFFYRFEEEFYLAESDWNFRFSMNFNQSQGGKKKEKKKENQNEENEGESELPNSEIAERRREIPQTCIVMGFSMEAAKRVRKQLMEMLEEELAA